MNTTEKIVPASMRGAIRFVDNWGLLLFTLLFLIGASPTPLSAKINLTPKSVELGTANGASKIDKVDAPTSTNAVITVTSINNSGAGSLRTAITTANSTPGPDEIIFNISTGTAPHVIAVTTQLPNITEDLTITGNSNVRISPNGNSVFSIQAAANVTLEDLDLSATPGSNSIAINIFPIGDGTIFRNSNIIITNNNLSGHRQAINARAADGLTITGNDFSNNGTDEFDAAIIVDDVTLFSANNNNFQGAAAGFLLRNMDGVHFDSDVSANPDVLLVSGDNFSTVTSPIIASTCDNITIKNLDLSGATGGKAINLLGTSGSPFSNIIIDNNTFSGHISGLSVVLADGVTITNNDFTGTSDPVTATSALSLHQITNLEAYGNDFTDVEDAISLFNMDGLKIDNVQGPGTNLVLEDDSGIAAALQALTIQNMTNTTVQNLTFSSQGPRAIYVNSGDNNTFTGLHFNNSIIGLDMTNGADDNTIECSTFTNIGGTGTGTAAVQTLNSTGLIMTNNTFGCLNGAKAILAISGFVQAENNYFGSSGDPDASDFSGSVDFEPFLTSAASCAPDGEAACPSELGCDITGIDVNDDVVGTAIGSVVETASITKEFTISNGGSSPLTVSGITSNDAKFTIESFTNNSILAPAATVTFTVRFTPEAGFIGNASATISIDSDDCNENPLVINVTAESLEARAYNPQLDRYFATLMDAIDAIEDNGANQTTLIIAEGNYMEGLDTTNKNLKITFGPLPDTDN